MWRLSLLAGLFSLAFGSDFPISTAEGSQTYPKVSWCGTNFLAIWLDFREGFRDSAAIYGQLLSSDGEHTGPDFKILAPSPVSLGGISSSGDSYLLVWTFWNGEIRSFGQLISIDGELLNGNFPLSDEISGFPDVTSDGVNYLVVFTKAKSETTTQIVGRFITPKGEFIGEEFAISQKEGKQHWLPKILWSGKNYLAVWQEGEYPPNILGQIVGSDGKLLGENFVIIETECNCDRLEKDIASDGSNFLVVWANMGYDSDNKIYAQLIDNKGEPMDSPFVITQDALFDPDARGLAVDYDDNSYLIVWTDCRNYHTNSSVDIYGQRVSPLGKLIGKNFPVTKAKGYAKILPDIVWNGSRYLIAWTQSLTDSGESDIYGNLDITIGIEETFHTFKKELKCLPNPCRDYTIISGVPSPSRLKVYDKTGRVLTEINPGLWRCRTLPPGVYFIREEEVGATAKLIKLK